MKRAFLIFTLLCVSVFSTACINNKAVQELNDKALLSMNKGEYNQAIEYLKSSLELDNNIYETHYNLAVVYTQNDDYKNAIEEYIKAININPQNPDAYYSMATAQLNLITSIKTGVLRMDNETGNLYKPEDADGSAQDLTNEEKTYINGLQDSILKNYQKYLELNPQAEEKAEIEKTIAKINEQRAQK